MWQQRAYMEGMNQHIDFQIALAGGKRGGGSAGGNASSDQAFAQFGTTETPDDIPDIGSMIPIEKVN